MVDKITSFEQLTVWQDAIELAAEIYRLTASFPESERYGITNQLRRSSASISANIAEGFGRRTKKEKIRFYTIAYGSLLEVKSFLYLAEKLAYINSQALVKLVDKIVTIQKQVNALGRSIKQSA